MLVYLFIFISRVMDVSLATFRTLMVVRGKRTPAAIIGFFEITIYVMVLGTVVGDMNDPLKVLSYGLGYAAGNYLGVTIEGIVAIGNVSVQIIPSKPENEEFKKILRDAGFAVTVLKGEGREGPREILYLTIDRRNLRILKNLAYDYDEKAFITVNDVNPLSGGYFANVKR